MCDGPKARVSAPVVRASPARGTLFGVVAKRTYDVRDGRCIPSPEQVPLVEAPIIDENAGRLVRESDLIITRDAVDLVILGHAYSPYPVKSFLASLRTREFSREIRVTGDRRVDMARDGRLVFSEPERVEQMPLDWDHAYGGVDHVGLTDIGDPLADMAADAGEPLLPTQTLYAYPRNPFGKGYMIERSVRAIEACALPNLEDPTDPVTPDNLVRRHFVTWPLAPLPAATGWLSYEMFPRCTQLGLAPAPYDEAKIEPEHFYEVRAGLLSPAALDDRTPLAERMNLRAASQCAALGMRAPEISPVAAFELSNMHPEQRRWTWSLPGEVPRMAYRLPREGAVEVAPSIRSVVIEPDAARVSVVWAGSLEVEVPLTPSQVELLEDGVSWG